LWQSAEVDLDLCRRGWDAVASVSHVTKCLK